MMKRFGVDRWLSEGAPVFWVLGISLVFLGLAVGLLHALFVFLDWQIPALVARWAIGVIVTCFVACVIWFIGQALTGRPTPWRRP